MRSKSILFALFSFVPVLLLAQDFSLGIGGDFVPKVKAAGIRRGIGYHFDFTYLEQQRVGFVTSVGWYKEALFSEGQASSSGGKYTTPLLKSGDNFMLDGQYSLYWLEAAPMVVLYRHIKYDVALNLGLGVGLYYAKNTWNWDVKNNLYRTAVEDGVCYREEPIRPNFGYNVRTSFDFPVTRKSRLRVEAKYVIYRPSIDYEICFDSTQPVIHGNRKLELDTLFLSLAIIFNL